MHESRPAETWVQLVMGLGFTLNVHAVFAIRFLLGIAESSFGPVLTTSELISHHQFSVADMIVAVTVQWFTAGEQTLIATTWQAMLGVSSAVGNLLAYGFYHVKGEHPLYGWQWLTVCIALISFCATGECRRGLPVPDLNGGFLLLLPLQFQRMELTFDPAVIYFFLPDSPPQARWATDDEKTKYVERVRVNDQGLKQKVWRPEQAWEAARDPITYLLFIMYLTQSTIVGGLNTFSGLLVNRAFGFSVSDQWRVPIPPLFSLGKSVHWC